MSESILEKQKLRRGIGVAVMSTLFISCMGLGFYNLYLYSVQYHDVSNLERRYDQVSSSLLMMQQQLEQNQQVKLHFQDNMDRLVERVARYQDNMVTVQAELVNLRRDVEIVQKMPQIDLGRRLEILSLLATEMSVEYARQQLVMRRQFQSALDQLNISKKRLMVSDADPNLLNALDASIEKIQGWKILEDQARIVERLNSMEAQLVGLPFKKTTADFKDAPLTTKQDVPAAESGWRKMISLAWEQFKSAFVIQKGQILDLTPLTTEGRLALMNQMKSLIQNARESYQMGDGTWFISNVDTLTRLSQRYFDIQMEPALSWIKNLDQLKMDYVKIDVEALDLVTQALQNALKKNSYQPLTTAQSLILEPPSTAIGGNPIGGNP